MWMWIVLGAVAWADQTGATVVCAETEQECVTTGGLPGVCDEDLVCVTDCVDPDKGEACAVEGARGTCDADGVCRLRTGCTTVPRGPLPLFGGLLLLLISRSRSGPRRTESREQPARAVCQPANHGIWP